MPDQKKAANRKTLLRRMCAAAETEKSTGTNQVESSGKDSGKCIFEQYIINVKVKENHSCEQYVNNGKDKKKP